MKKRYILCPGWATPNRLSYAQTGFITSKNDRQRHYISAYLLCHLYGVEMQDCIVREIKQHWPASVISMEIRSINDLVAQGLILLQPRFDGDYSLPKSVKS